MWKQLAIFSILFPAFFCQHLRVAAAADDSSTIEERLHAGKVAVEELHATLKEYYSGHDAMEQSYVLQKSSPGYEEGLERISDKFARAIVWGDKFVVGAIGSSVTAGHDNCAYDSYEAQLERTMAPVAKSLGIEIEVRNAGEGGSCGDSFQNQIWCMRHMVGDDVDVTHYSWSYFESGQSKIVHKFHEMFIRWSLLMDRSPVPLIIYAGAGKEVLFTGSYKTLLDAYGKWGFNQLHMQKGLLATHPSLLTGKRWGEVGDGVHNITRYGLKEESARQKSLGVNFRNWHPGPLCFQTLADSIAWHYANAIHLALRNIREESEPRVRWPKSPKLVMVGDLPKPAFCSEDWCMNNDEGPSCVNFELPTFGNPQIKVFDDDDQFNDEKSLYNKSLPDFHLWEAGPNVKMIPREERDLPKCQHADQCRGWRKNKNEPTNPITFRLPRMTVGFIAVCGCCKKTMGEIMIENGMKVVFDTKPITNLTTIFDKCVQVQEKFTGPVINTNGHLTLSIEFPAESGEMTISHVMTL